MRKETPNRKDRFTARTGVRLLAAVLFWLLVFAAFLRFGGGLGLLGLLVLIVRDLGGHELIGGAVLALLGNDDTHAGIAAFAVDILNDATILAVVDLMETFDAGDVQGGEDSGTDVGIDDSLGNLHSVLPFLVLSVFLHFLIRL